MATLKDIARYLGISISTASLAYRDHPSISLKTKQRVWAAGESLGYRAPRRVPGSARRNVAAAQLATHDIAFLLIDDDFAAPAYSSIVRQLAISAAQRQWRPVCIACSGEELGQGKIPPLVIEGGFSGMIVAGKYGRATHHCIAKLGIPLVALGRFDLGDHFLASCEHDEEQSQRMIIRRMKELGHRKFGWLTSDEAWQGHHPLAYHTAIKAEGVESIGIAQLKPRRGADFLTLAALLKRKPTALLIDQPEQTAAVYETAQKFGMRIPADLSVICGSDASQSVVVPSLSYLETHPRLAERLIQKLGELIADPKTVATRELFPRRFVPGGSIARALT